MTLLPLLLLRHLLLPPGHHHRTEATVWEDISAIVWQQSMAKLLLVSRLLAGTVNDYNLDRFIPSCLSFDLTRLFLLLLLLSATYSKQEPMSVLGCQYRICLLSLALLGNIAWEVTHNGRSCRLLNLLFRTIHLLIWNIVTILWGIV